jgi:serine/threonine protein kinase
MFDETMDEPKDFLQLALREKFLSSQQAEEIVAAASTQKISIQEAATELRQMTAAQVRAVEQLMEPRAVAPGYVALALIGCGGSGTVFRARQTALNRDVAIKTVDLTARRGDTLIRRLQREANSIAQLDHPHIVSIYDCGLHSNHFYIAMELVVGQDLASLIQSSFRLPERTAWQIARQIASALAHAHHRGIVHRDIKPANVLLTKTPVGSDVPLEIPFAKVADFGLALQASDMDEPSITAEGTSLGTPAFVAPEQLKDTHVDQRADIYALGATLFHMLTGKPPFLGKSSMQVLVSKTVGDDGWRDDVKSSCSDSTFQLFRDMTAYEVEDRISDYGELLRRIDTVIEALPADDDVPLGTTREFSTDVLAAAALETQDAHEVQHGQRSRSKLGGRVIAVLALILALSAGGVSLLSRSQERPLSVTEHLQWTISGPPERLFNGRSVPRFRKSRTWLRADGIEGESVLMAESPAWIELPLRMQGDEARDLRLSFSVRLDDAAKIRVEIAAADGRLVTLQIDETSAQLLPGADARFSGFRQVALEKPGDSYYHVCSFFKTEEQLTVVVNGLVVGAFECDASQTDAVTLHIVEGRIDLADLELFKLEPKKPASLGRP